MRYFSDTRLTAGSPTGIRLPAWALAASALLMLHGPFPVAGWVLLLAAGVLFWRVSETPRADPPLSRWGEAGGLALIVAVAAGLRFWRLGALPPGCWLDEALCGLETLKVTAGRMVLISPAMEGYGGLAFYWNAPFFALLGANVSALRAASALIGVLTIPAAWALFRAVAGPRPALAGAAFLAVSAWHLALSRLGFGAIAVPLFDCFIVYAVFRAGKTGSRGWLVLAGLVTGVAQYGYFSARLSLLLFAAAVWIFWPQAPERRARMRSGLGLALLVLVAALSPLAVHFLGHPGELFGRPTEISTLRKVIEEKNPGAMLRTLRSTARMLFERGDLNARHNLPGAPMLDVATGLFFFAGLIGLIKKKARSAPEKMILVWLVLPLFFGGVLTEPSPHGPRTLAALIPIGLIAGLGLESAFSGRSLRSRAALRAAVLAAAALLTWRQYFVLYPACPDLRTAFSARAYQVGRYLRDLPAGAALRVADTFNPAVVRFVAGDPGSRLTAFSDPGAQMPEPGTVYIFAREADVPAALKAETWRCAAVTRESESFVVCRQQE